MSTDKKSPTTDEVTGAVVLGGEYLRAMQADSERRGTPFDFQKKLDVVAAMYATMLEACSPALLRRAEELSGRYADFLSVARAATGTVRPLARTSN